MCLDHAKGIAIIPGSRSPFLESISRHMLTKRYSKRTIDTYLYWIKYFINFHKKRHPTDMGGAEVEQFLNFLAVDRKVSAATQGLALNALAFLYNRFLEKPMGNVGNFRRSSIQAKLPVVLTRSEVHRLLDALSGTPLWSHRCSMALACVALKSPDCESEIWTLISCSCASGSARASNTESPRLLRNWCPHCSDMC